MNPDNYRNEIVVPTLKALKMWSAVAEELIMTTAIHESEGLQHIRQIGGGPAVSFLGTEPATALDICGRNYLGRPDKKRLRARFWNYFGRTLINERYLEFRLLGDMRFAVGIARLKYWRSPLPLPRRRVLKDLAKYWSRLYNTDRDPHKEADFIADNEAMRKWLKIS